MRPGAPMLSPRLIFYVRNITLLGFTAALAVVIRMSREWRKAEEARREAENARTDAELKTLRNQLSPHFLLNTLNNIYALIAFDTDKAQTAVLELSKMLRHMLYDNHQKFVPLQSEADFIRNYVELMRLRLSHEVKVEVDIKVDSGRNTQIAPLIFISLVENAFKHGISPTEPSFVRINLFEENEYVHCNIQNSNFPKNREDKSGSGIGLEQVKRRLELLYPDCYKWTRSTMEEGRVYVSDLIIKTNHDSELCNN
jgi:LytS/YehU family sensor histidine kinase